MPNALFSQRHGPDTDRLRPLYDLERGDLVAVEMLPARTGQQAPFHAQERLPDSVRDVLRDILPRRRAFLCLSLGPDALASRSLAGNMSDLAAVAGSTPRATCLFFDDQDCLSRGLPALEALLMLKRTGFRIGLNIRSLAHMPAHFVERLPVDVLRLDPLEARPLTGYSQAGALLGDFTRFAANLLMTPAARGVRSMEELDMLRTAGFSIAQGPLFAGDDLCLPKLWL